MFKFTNPFKKEESNLDKLIQATETKLMCDISDDEREKTMKLMKDLYALRDKELSRKLHVDGNTLATCATSLSSVLLMLNYEKLGVVRSKALNFIIKGKV